MLEILRACAAVMDNDSTFGDAMTVAEGEVAALPQVGLPGDAESMRLFVHMLHARVRRSAGAPADELPATCDTAEDLWCHPLISRPLARFTPGVGAVHRTGARPWFRQAP